MLTIDSILSIRSGYPDGHCQLPMIDKQLFKLGWCGKVFSVPKTTTISPIQAEDRKDYQEWAGNALAIAEMLPARFFFSDLRVQLKSPANSHWWGKLATTLLDNGYCRTGAYRASPIKENKGHEDKEYARKIG